VKNHITQVVKHYQGKIGWWDAVNEGIADYPPCNMRIDSIWYQVIGSDYIDEAFKAARAADPDVKLF
jgi:endo-1,4-beta-xylanase